MSGYLMRKWQREAERADSPEAVAWRLRNNECREQATRELAGELAAAKTADDFHAYMEKWAARVRELHQERR